MTSELVPRCHGIVGARPAVEPPSGISFDIVKSVDFLEISILPLFTSNQMVPDLVFSVSAQILECGR